ncbi:hypothetical protein [Aliarcobacter butzleri]|uniref:hypothetical protein n=1 Tax=Aliarcobacter butzleri TaxID=28197 RepID=UPI001EDBE76C|nr:hypothetical protein [Aliarcobacter butzleri]MCG3655471.1 hypothetical protein [Aliarcobacter butzleri]MCT7555999.1 hypothetical protein [Aliarcobacter butzleri]MCT7595007.1 hypothetical protein [Aliarcobacter butzleri]MCT7602560.1 hypothetical protein [Aliarcobacter butzleri]MCT7604610.1 hypothetical protein [Aliarcobacter butzleri]
MVNVINDRNISFRLANSSDFEYVKNLLTEGVQEGHYLKTLIENEDKFNQTVNALILQERDLSRDAITQTVICLCGSVMIGFLSIASLRGGICEFWYFSLDKKYQNMGFGYNIICKIEKMYEEQNFKQEPIFMARCHKNSSNMINILLKKNYIQKNGDEKDWYTFLKCKDKNIMKSLKNFK